MTFNSGSKSNSDHMKSSILDDWRPEWWDEVLADIRRGISPSAALGRRGFTTHAVNYWIRPRDPDDPQSLPRNPAMAREWEEALAAGGFRKYTPMGQKPEWWDELIQRIRDGATITDACFVMSVATTTVYKHVAYSRHHGDGSLAREWEEAITQSKVRRIGRQLPEIRKRLQAGESMHSIFRALRLSWPDWSAFLREHPELERELEEIQGEVVPDVAAVRFLCDQLAAEERAAAEIAEETGDSAELEDVRLLRTLVEVLSRVDKRMSPTRVRDHVLAVLLSRYDYREDMPGAARKLLQQFPVNSPERE